MIRKTTIKLLGALMCLIITFAPQQERDITKYKNSPENHARIHNFLMQGPPLSYDQKISKRTLSAFIKYARQSHITHRYSHGGPTFHDK